jgi:alkylhydroperoxidase/carboxymuconolactone decarboxylase family protein YurZ
MTPEIVESEERAVARERLSKHISAATNTNATTEELLEALFSMRSPP